MITDKAIIEVSGGRGGDGSASFRREKFIPKGGPDGGDGGKGGGIYIEVNPAVHTLSYFVGKKDFKAQKGQPGSGNRRFGKYGEDLVLSVPPGTTVSRLDEDGEEKKLADMINSGDRILVVKGGKGGWGNVHFATATHQTPTEFNPGQPGEKATIKLELKLIADVGLVGFPNAGKSTLISHISHAHPEIADYPFTTITPVLGKVYHKESEFIVADIPGLIEGAAKGKGLGHQFLRHIERTRILVHILDATDPDPDQQYHIIRQELAAYSPDLIKKEEIIVLNKVDTLLEKELKTMLNKLSKKIGQPILPLSAVSGQGIETLLNTIISNLKS